MVMHLICLHGMFSPSEVFGSSIDHLKPDSFISVLVFTTSNSFSNLMLSFDEPQIVIKMFSMSFSTHCLAKGTCFFLAPMKIVAAKGEFSSVTRVFLYMIKKCYPKNKPQLFFYDFLSSRQFRIKIVDIFEKPTKFCVKNV